MKCVDHFRRMLLELLERRAAHAVADAKPPFVLADHIEHHLVGRQVTFGRYLAQDLAILVFVEVMAVGIEDAVAPQAKGLMNLKVETDRSHIHVPVIEHPRGWPGHSTSEIAAVHERAANFARKFASR